MNTIRKAYLTVLYRLGFAGHHSSRVKGSNTWKAAWNRAGHTMRD